VTPFWAQGPAAAASSLGVALDGLSSREAAERLARFGRNEIHPSRSLSRLRVLWRQVRSPLVLLLVFAAIASAASGEWVDASIVGAIITASVGLGYRREYRAECAIEGLLARIRLTADVVRDGTRQAIPIAEVVPGDILVLAAGSIVPADALLVEADELHVDEAVLTGESFPVVKRPGMVPAKVVLRERTNSIHFGTNVRSGTGRALVIATGHATAFGAIAGSLATRAPETELERGLWRFGRLLLVAILVMVLVVFAANVFLGRPVLDTLLFAIALAVGLSPELLPAIVGVNLGRSAQILADTGVLVRRLDAIENLGSMNVLCTDKTGTLTEGVVSVSGAFDPRGVPSTEVMELAVLNAALQAGLPNPLDAALLAGRAASTSEKLAEIPYDFTRKRLSVIVARDGDALLVMKGAVAHVLEVCERLADGAVIDTALRDELATRTRAWAEEGNRVLAVARRSLDHRASYTADDERGLELVGFVTLLDRPKDDAARTLAKLRDLGVRVKMITGDSRYVATHVARVVGIDATNLLAEQDLHELTDVALVRAVVEADVFAEVDPNQKERIVRALRKSGAVVGFFGDGVNDTPAMHGADVSISVESAVDVAKATADLLLTRKGLDVIARGIAEGRRTFANTLKYVLTTTSANLGNMVSMAAASLVLPFLPLTAGQVLLNNFLSDIPAIGIASDCVDAELVDRPRRWDTRFIGRFMLEFGLLSSAFDVLTFGVLVFGFDAGESMFRTGWFVESLLTELVIALVVRTRRPVWRSRPGRLLAWTTGAVALAAFALPVLPHAGVLGFTSTPPSMLAAIVAITIAYVVAAELMKSWFYRGPR
jgi:Mg2+-importing ATPase